MGVWTVFQAHHELIIRYPIYNCGAVMNPRFCCNLNQHLHARDACILLHDSNNCWNMSKSKVPRIGTCMGHCHGGIGKIEGHGGIGKKVLSKSNNRVTEVKQPM